MSSGVGGQCRGRPVISIDDRNELNETASQGKINDKDAIQMTEGYDFGCVLAEFEQEVCSLALKLAEKRHILEDETTTTTTLSCESHGTHLGKRQEERILINKTAALKGAVGNTAAVVERSYCNDPPKTSIPVNSVNKRKIDDPKLKTKSSYDTSCIQVVALNVWATLGFFSPPPFELDPLEKEARSENWRSRPSDIVDSSSKSVEPNDNEEESIFCVVSSLEMYYKRKLSTVAGVLLDKMQENKKEREVSDELLRNGLWQVLFNAVFYCMTAPGTGRGLTLRDLECYTGGVGGRYDVVYSSSSASSALSSSDDSEEQQEEREQQREGKTNVRRVFAKLRWHTRETLKERTNGRGMRQLSRRDPLCRLTTAHERESQHHATLDEAIEGRRQTPFSSLPLASSSSLSLTGVAPVVLLTEVASKRTEFNDRLRRCMSPFGGRLELPMPIKSWYFVLRVLARMGYTRDVFYTQTPLYGSIHELLLALLWITKEYQLVAVAEYVQLQNMYPFLLKEDSPIRDGKNSNTSNGSNGCGAKDIPAHTATAIGSGGETLLNCFPAAVPWPPASFIEKEHIAHRLGQLKRILPEPSEKGNVPALRMPDIARRLLSVQRLIALSMNRLECALHQRAEQTATLGLHSALDIQLCHPAHHDAYRKLCSGLQHLRGMETRVRETTQQLSQLGSLVARALRQEVTSRQQQQFQAAVIKAIEDDELTQLRQQQQYSEEGEIEGRTRWRLHDVFTRFRATGTNEHLTDLWASLRRAAQVGLGADRRAECEDVAKSTLLQTQLEEQVRQNMAARYSLDAVLKAELRTWQLRGSGVTQDGHDEGKDVVTMGEEEEEKKRRGGSLLNHRGLSKRRRCAHSKNMKQSFVTVDLALNHISSHCSQAMAVGRPAENATTSACLEIERLQEALCALRGGEEYLKKRLEERQITQDALQLIHNSKLRVVYRKK